MRSEYSWLPPDGSVTVTKPYQIGVSFSAHDRLVYQSGGHARYLTVPAGSVFATAHHDAHWAEVTEPTDALEIYPDLELLREAAGVPGPGALELAPVVAGRDAIVLGLAGVLKRAHIRNDIDTMQASTVAHRLAEHLTDHYCHPLPRRPQMPGRLDRALVDRVAELVEANLGERLTLDDLAAQARLSVYHFARAFKATIGMAPHEFVTMRRMERATTLLVQTRRSVPDIAYAVGYANVSHFRRLFHRHRGVAPSELRAAIGGDGRRWEKPMPASRRGPRGRSGLV